MSIEVIEHGEMAADVSIPRLTAEEISQVAKDYQAGHIFGSWQLGENQANMLPSIFMVLIFLDELTVKKVLNSGQVFCYEHMSKAGHLSVNGYPTFMSCRMIVIDDVKLILEKAKKIEDLLASI